MFFTDIPEKFNKVIKDYAQKGHSPEGIAHLLRTAGWNVTAGTVRARMRDLVIPIVDRPVDLEREVWASLAANLSDLSEIEGRLRDLDKLAFDRDEPLEFRVKQTQKNLKTRADLILSKHKLLQLALTERVKRKLLEAQLATKPHPPPVVSPQVALPPTPPPPAALPEPSSQVPTASLMPATEKEPA